MKDPIERDAAMASLVKEYNRRYKMGEHGLKLAWIEKAINAVPSAVSETPEIGYSYCANAMLKMWMDNVLTDGEYYRIMEKLDKHWTKEG